MMSRRLTPRSTQVTRREMLCNTTVAGIGIWTAAAGSSAGQSQSPNEKLSIAGIGVGGQGGVGHRQLREREHRGAV